jgi:glucosamine-6-phosphate deaminase
MAITMGIGTIMQARRCLLLATGEAKAAAVRAMLEDPPSPGCPASALQAHPGTLVVLDRQAASQLADRRWHMTTNRGAVEDMMAK